MLASELRSSPAVVVKEHLLTFPSFKWGKKLSAVEHCYSANGRQAENAVVAKPGLEEPTTE